MLAAEIDPSVASSISDEPPDLERRFGALRRLYGDAGYARVRSARIAVVGLGGVGSWAAEALARCGVAALTLIDLDHVAESNINRQVQAIGATVGASKVQALTERITGIHPGCEITGIEEFVDADNWPALLPQAVDVVIDACDQVRAKAVVAAWGLRTGTRVVSVGAAGGKRRPEQVQVDDLSRATHDPLLASLRYRLRKFHDAPREGAIGIVCVFSREAVQAPRDLEACDIDGNLNCHGYGSTVAVTATFGMVAANVGIESSLDTEPSPTSPRL